MTLRDCTVFLRFPSEARLGDLDVKSPDKEKYWKETEQDLINSGFYHGTEKEGWSNDCALGPKQEGRFG
jgi:inositol-pentakisphosphate 2-kinase